MNRQSFSEPTRVIALRKVIPSLLVYTCQRCGHQGALVGVTDEDFVMTEVTAVALCRCPRCGRRRWQMVVRGIMAHDPLIIAAGCVLSTVAAFMVLGWYTPLFLVPTTLATIFVVLRLTMHLRRADRLVVFAEKQVTGGEDPLRPREPDSPRWRAVFALSPLLFSLSLRAMGSTCGGLMELQRQRVATMLGARCRTPKDCSLALESGRSPPSLVCLKEVSATGHQRRTGYCTVTCSHGECPQGWECRQADGDGDCFDTAAGRVCSAIGDLVCVDPYFHGVD